MMKLPKQILAFLSADRAVPLILAVVCAAAYAPGIRWMGIYWDDWPLTWISQNLGNAGLAQYFSTNRPVWGLLYQLTMPVIGVSPLAWQAFAILARLLAALACWTLIRQVWPARRWPALQPPSGAQISFAC